jgi:hypothetical protein
MGYVQPIANICIHNACDFRALAKRHLSEKVSFEAFSVLHGNNEHANGFRLSQAL